MHLGRLLLVAAPFLAAACAVPVAAPAPVASSASPLARELTALCESFRVEHGIVGLRVAVLRADELVYDQGFGFANRERCLPVEAGTLFRIGSISKPVAATLALQLVEAGALELDGDLRLHLPASCAHLPPLTLRQVLSHTAGVRHYQPGKADNSSEHRTTAEALALFIGDPLLAAPGERYSYSTHAYTLAVAAIEQASGRDFVALARERLRAHGLASLDCELRGEAKPARVALYDKPAQGEALLQPVAEDNSWKYGGGGFESTASDLARFGAALLQGKFVRTHTREEMWSPTRLADGTTSDYGLGWRLAQDRKAVYHTGSQQGAHAALWIVPQEELVIAVLSNTRGGGAPELAPLVRARVEASGR